MRGEEKAKAMCAMRSSAEIDRREWLQRRDKVSVLIVNKRVVSSRYVSVRVLRRLRASLEQYPAANERRADERGATQRLQPSRSSGDISASRLR